MSKININERVQNEFAFKKGGEKYHLLQVGASQNLWLESCLSIVFRKPSLGAPELTMVK